jgi:hypothetical protein
VLQPGQQGYTGKGLRWDLSRVYMGEPDKLFTDGEAYERLMGRWSRIAAEAFLDWLNPAKNLRWLDVGCGNGAFTGTDCSLCARNRDGDRSFR